MSKQHPTRPSRAVRRAAAASRPKGAPDLAFEPIGVAPRHDGWNPDKQQDFIEALAESGCVAEACARVGMTTTSAYALRRRVDAGSFRLAWEAALDYAIRRLSDAAFARALNGVSRPVYFQGEAIGERRYYDERLTMFLLRYRDPVRYGAWLDRRDFTRHPDGAAIQLAQLVNHVVDDAWADELGHERYQHPAVELFRHASPERAVEDPIAREQRAQREFEESINALVARVDAERAERGGT